MNDTQYPLWDSGLRLAELREEIDYYSQRCFSHTSSTRTDVTLNRSPIQLRQNYNSLIIEESSIMMRGETVDPLERLPPEIWNHCIFIASECEPGFLLMLMSVCTAWATRIAECEWLWSRLYLNSSSTSIAMIEAANSIVVDMPFDLTIKWPVSDELWKQVKLIANRTSHLRFDLKDGATDYSASILHRRLLAFRWPVLEYLFFSPRFDATLSYGMNLTNAPRLHQIQGISQTFPNNRLTPRFVSLKDPGAWVGDKLVVRKGTCRLTHIRKRLRGEIGDYRQYVITLELKEASPSSWFHMEFPSLRHLKLAIDAGMVPDAMRLISLSSILHTLKLVIYTDHEAPEALTTMTVPTSLIGLRHLHLEIGLRTSRMAIFSSQTVSDIARWLVGCLSMLLLSSSSISELTFRIVDGPLDSDSTRNLTRLLNSLTSLQRLTMPTEISSNFQDIDEGRIRLPRLKHLLIRQEDILQFLEAPSLTVIELMSRRYARHPVNIPPDIIHLIPSVTTLQYGSGRTLGGLCGRTYEHVCTVDFLKADADAPNIWPSDKVDQFCELLLDARNCPSLHTIGTCLFPGWDSLFRLLALRNIFLRGKAVHAIDCIRIPFYPNRYLLETLVMLLRGLYPHGNYGNLFPFMNYDSLTRNGCFNCLAGDLVCEAAVIRTGNFDNIAAVAQPTVNTIDDILLSSKDEWEVFSRHSLEWRLAMKARVRRQLACSLYRARGEWLHLTPVTATSLDLQELSTLYDSGPSSP